MAALAFLVGIYSYLILGLGILGFLYKRTIILLTLIYLGSVLWYFRKDLGRMKRIMEVREIKDRASLPIFLILMAQILVNLVGALGPELGFDALWYHLTLPKIYLQFHRIFYIPGSLFYYSAMPKLIEMLYLSSLAFQGEILAKILHFVFGVLSCLTLFRLSRRYLGFRASLLATVSFYSSLIVGWQSITAYVDLGRTFFEILALDYFLRWWKSERNVDLLESALLLGLAISSKLLAAGSIVIYLALIFIKYRKKMKVFFVFSLQYSIFSLLVPLPWLVFSFVHTKNPLYPFFTSVLNSPHWVVNFSLSGFLTDFWNLFLYSPDPINPLFLIIIPLVIILLKKNVKIEKIVLAYCFLGYFVWFISPRSDRYFLPYLPAFSFVIASVYQRCMPSLRGKFIWWFIFFICLFNLFYRSAANWRYVPVILGRQTKEEFLVNNLNFKFGDFYDYQNQIRKLLQPNDLVLTSGIHNLFYVDFPNIDESWAKPGLLATHLLVKGNLSSNMSERVNNKQPIYFNRQLDLRLYVLGGKL